jgi:hypothetical protein
VEPWVGLIIVTKWKTHIPACIRTLDIHPSLVSSLTGLPQFDWAITNSMDLSHSGQAASHTPTWQLLNTLWNPEVHYRVQNSPLLVPILNQINPLHTIPSTPLKCILILSIHVRFGLPSGLFPSNFPTNILYAFPLFPFVLHAIPTSFSLPSSF